MNMAILQQNATSSAAKLQSVKCLPPVRMFEIKDFLSFPAMCVHPSLVTCAFVASNCALVSDQRLGFPVEMKGIGPSHLCQCAVSSNPCQDAPGPCRRACSHMPNQWHSYFGHCELQNPQSSVDQGLRLPLSRWP